MKVIYVIVCCLLTFAVFAAEASNESSDEMIIDDVNFKAIPLPGKDNPEYWVIRSDAVSEIIPLLTKKRAEIKEKRLQAADYLDRAGKTEAMAAEQIEVPEDPALYAMALGWSENLCQRDIDLPKTLPSWEETVEFAMRFIIDEGYVPIEFDGVEDIQGFVDVCKRKETYARKVRDEMRVYLKDYLEMRLYLQRSGQQFAYRDWVTQSELEAQRADQAARDRLAEQRRQAALERREQGKEKSSNWLRTDRRFVRAGVSGSITHVKKYCSIGSRCWMPVMPAPIIAGKRRVLFHSRCAFRWTSRPGSL